MADYTDRADEFEGNAVRRAVPEEIPTRIRRKDLKAEKKRRQNLIRITEKQMRRSRLAGVNPVKAVATILLVVIGFSLLFGTLYGKVQLTELYEQIEEKQTELERLQGVEVQLQMQMDSDQNSTELENYAKTVLGMTKATADQTYYVNLAGGDTAVIQQEAEKTFLQKVWDRICSWF